MNFNVLVENYLNQLTEGVQKKSEKYSNFEIDTEKLNDDIENGTFDSVLEVWSNNPRYANKSLEELKNVVRNVSGKISDYGISTYEDLKNAVDDATDEAFADKGPKRKTYRDRLTRFVLNLLFHKEYDLVNLDVSPVDKSEEDILTGLTEMENAIVDFIDRSDEPVNSEDVERNFPNSEEILNSLLSKDIISVDTEGYLHLMGSKETEQFDDEDYDEDLSSELGLSRNSGIEDENMFDVDYWDRSASDRSYREL